MGFVYRIASPSEYLAITGYGIDDVKLAKKAWIAPGQRCARFDISPVNYTFEVQAMSVEQLPFILPAVFTIGPRSDDEECLIRYFKLISPHDKLSHHVNELVKGVIEGETRVLAASMTMEEIFRGTESFKQAVFENVQLELNQFGLVIYNANVKQFDMYNEAAAAYLYHPGVRDATKDNDFGAPTTEGQDKHGAAYVFSAARTGATAAHCENDAAAAYLYYPGSRDGAKHDDGGAAYQHHYSGAPTTEGQDVLGAAYAAAPAKNGAPVIFSVVCAAAQDEDAKVYLDFDTPAAAKNRRGAAAERGKGNVHFFELPRVIGFATGRGEKLPYQTQTTAAAVEPPAAGYYNSGVAAGEALPLASQVFAGRTTSAPAVAVGQDKVAGAFPERLRRGLPVLGLSVASLAVAGLAAGEPTPAAGFGLFLMLILGLSTVTIRALRD